MKKLFSYFLLLAAVCGLGVLQPAAAQRFDWAKRGGNLTTYPLNGTAAATDTDGNTYSAIGFRDSIRVGNQVLHGPASAIVKYDSTGQVRWVKRITGLEVNASSMAVDRVSGGVFFLGTVAAGATWNGVAIGAAASANFYGKCSPTGSLLWHSRLPGPAMLNQSVTPASADGLGNYYVLGRATSATTIGTLAVAANNFFVAQIIAGGTVGWTRQLHSVGGTMVANLGTRLNGGCLLHGALGAGATGLAFGTTNPPTVFTTTAAAAPPFVASIDETGTMQSFIVTTFPLPAGTNRLDAVSAATDLAGNTYVSGSTTFGAGVAKYSATSTLSWLKQSTETGGRCQSLVVDPAGQHVSVLVTGTSPWGGGPVRLDSVLLPSPLNLVRFNAQGRVQWVMADDPQPLIALPPGGYGSPAYFDVYALGLDRRGNAYCVGNIARTSFNPQPPLLLGDHTVIGDGSFVTKINAHYNQLTGRIYYDQNGNGQRDAGEGNFPTPLVVQARQSTRTLMSSGTATGLFTLRADSGTYTLSLPNVPAHYTVTQPTTTGNAYTGHLAGYGRIDSLRHFGIAPIANQLDLRATLTPYGRARPGFITRYRLTLENVGTAPVPAGTATLTLDARAQYVGSLPTATVSGQVLSWSYGSLAPFARRELDVMFSLPVNATAGAVLATTAAAPVTGDLVPADNSAVLNQTITSSFDPNAIDVNYQRLTPAQVAAQVPLDYTIHFQNMGTDTAYSVVLSDTLDFRKLNVGSLMLVAQSHSCIWSLSSTGLLTVRFLNIKLPHRNVDVIRSQGFVRFRVQPRATLAVGEVIPNHAGIVFDYNAPVITNTATTTVFLATAALARHDAPAWTAYPNPATDAITIAADLTTAGPVAIELLDMLGRPLRRQLLTAPAGPLRQLVDLHGLAAGVYLLRLTPPTGPATSRRVVLH